MVKEDPKLVLPQDALIRKALESKLVEYKGRLESFKEQHRTMHPELTAKLNASSIYKIAIVERLLERGEVSLGELAFELNKSQGFLDYPVYEGAVFVIEDYCRTGGANVSGGTGFPLERRAN